MTNFMRVGGGNITNSTPLHNSFTSVGGTIRPTDIPVATPHVNATAWTNPRLPSQVVRAQNMQERLRAVVSRLRNVPE